MSESETQRVGQVCTGIMAYPHSRGSHFQLPQGREHGLDESPQRSGLGASRSLRRLGLGI